MIANPVEDLIEEHRVLLDGYGRAQIRCSRLLAAQAAEIERLQIQSIRLRARAIVAESALAFAREEAAEGAAAASLHGPARRRAMGRQIEALGQRIHELMREVLHWQWRAARSHHATPPPVTVFRSGLAEAVSAPVRPMRSVVCIAQDAAGSLVAQPVGRKLPTALEDEAVSCPSLPSGNAALEASLIAADFVICQTGCVGHDDYWRVQDHCKRTGKPCVLVDQPQVVQIMRGLVLPQDGLVTQR